MAEARIVIVGGGFGGLFTALNLKGAGQITLVSDEDHFLFAPMLYEYLSGEVEEWHIAPKYTELLDEHVNLVQGQTQQIDLTNQRVTIEGNGTPLEYDVLILAVGGTTNYRGIEGVGSHFIEWMEPWDVHHIEPEEFVDHDDRVLVTIHVTARGGQSGMEIDQRFFQVYTVRHAKIRRMVEYVDRDQDVRAMKQRA